MRIMMLLLVFLSAAINAATVFAQEGEMPQMTPEQQAEIERLLTLVGQITFEGGKKGAIVLIDREERGPSNLVFLLDVSGSMRDENKLPLVKLTGTHAVQFKRGSTVEPILEVVQWVDRPASLTEGVAAGIAAAADETHPNLRHALYLLA